MCLNSFSAESDVLPRFLVEPRSQIIKPGNPAILTCSVEPSTAVVQWMFNGRTLTDTTHHRRGRSRDDAEADRVEVVIRRLGLSAHRSLTRNEHSLHIAAFDMSKQEGVYQCLATSSVGSLLSRPATIEPAGRLSHHFVCRQCRIKVGAIDAAALGPFVK